MIFKMFGSFIERTLYVLNLCMFKLIVYLHFKIKMLILLCTVGPKITKWEENLDVVAGQGVTLYCEVIADPPYRITWFKDGKQLEAYGQTLRYA